VHVGEVVAFRHRAAEDEYAWGADDPEPEVDLLTAVDVAIRDLADIIAQWGSPAALRQAEACRRLLLRSFEGAG
jgi:hypothetical protein